MSQQELLAAVVGALDEAGVPYMVTGSYASSLQGEPRATHDIDLLVDLPADRVDAILAAFPPPDFYVSADAVRAAVADRRMFNVLSIATGEKVDFWLVRDELFDRTRFARRLPDCIDELDVFVSTPEDTILQKLRWAADLGGSEKQFTDALRVYEVQHGILDQAYLAAWVGRLELGESWQRLMDAAEIVDPD